ncbi:MAG: hypothetical protein JNK78_11845 [Planctomycetes bacterium]|nr:hypothetical protein [Planctomycetota bacterium]
MHPADRPRSPFAGLLLVASLAVGAGNAWRFVGSVCDDAVISFRSVENQALGHGLVYNVDERLETFTNLGFVWLLAALRAAGADLFAAAGVIGFAAAVGALFATWWLAREAGLGRAAWAPVLFAAASTTLVGQAGSGLETTTCAFFTTLGLARVLQECRARGEGASRRHGAGALLLGCAVSMRPDSVCVLAGAIVCKAFLLDPSGRRRAIAADAVVATAVVAALTGFRLAYYGDPLPNPVHAKVGADFAVLKSGLVYWFEWVRADFGMAVLAVGLALAFAANGRTRLLAVLCAGWCAYVVLSGGDHMPYSRFFAPMLPAFAVALAAGMAPLFRGSDGVVGGRWRAAAGAVFVFALALQPAWSSVSRGNVPAKNMAHETFRREIGGFFAAEAARRGGRLVVACNPVGYVGFFAGPGVHVVDMLGLCDAHVAREGRRDTKLLVGHQVGDGAWVLAQRPDFVILGTATPGDLWQQRDGAALLREIRAAGVEAWAKANGHTVLVSEREMLAADELFAAYEPVEAPLPGGRSLHVLRRKA